jgi:uncharacterized protein YbaA (DUF1428 family)
MSYVVGFVLAVPKTKLAAYRALAKKSAKVWMKHGAIAVTECVADDVKPGKITSFPQAVKLKKNEVVVLSWVTYKSRKHRDQVNKRAFSDPFMTDYDAKSVFDGSRMFWGGFKTIVELG